MTPSRRKPKGKRKKQRKRDQYAGLKKKLAQGPFRADGVIIEPRGKVKMSDVLADFVEPYVEFADTDEAYRKLLMLAIMAWNASFLPEEEQREMIGSMLDAGIPDETGELRAGLAGIVNTLIERKKRYFAQYTRKIIDFELTDTGSGYHLTVASTLE